MDTTEGKVTHSEAAKDRLFSSPDTGIEGQVIKRALDSFDRNDKVISNALKAFLDAHERAVKKEEKREVVKRIESEEVIDAVVKLRRAEIELRAAEIRQTLAKKKFAIAFEELKLKAEEFEGFDEDYDLNIEKLLIVRKDKDLEEAAFRKIFEFAKSMADGTSEVPLQSIRRGNLPDHLNQSINEIKTNMKAFFKDFAEFLMETKVEGQRKVMQICEDPDLASEVACDDEEPAPLKFLATIFLKYVTKSV